MQLLKTKIAGINIMKINQQRNQCPYVKSGF